MSAPAATVAPRVALVVPTLNAGPQWRDWLAAYGRQSLKPNTRHLTIRIA